MAHPAPASSVEALAEARVLVVPPDLASGERTKILGAEAGRHLHLAGDAEAFVAAIAGLRDPSRRRTMVESARERLATEHDRRPVARQLVEIYQRARKEARNP